jgi:hypothetical protein
MNPLRALSSEPSRMIAALFATYRVTRTPCSNLPRLSQIECKLHAHQKFHLRPERFSTREPTQLANDNRRNLPAIRVLFS